MSTTRELGELSQRFVDVVPLRHRWTSRVVVTVLAVFAVVCVVAVVTRRSALPLVPLPAVAVSAFAHYRVRRARSDRALLVWSGVTVTAGLLALWLISVIGSAVS